MEHRNVTGHDGTVHQGLFNGYTGDFIDVACDAGRYAVVRHYEKLDLARVTDSPTTCAGCPSSTKADVARACAVAVLAEADGRGYPPAMDNEGLRLAFVRLVPSGGELHPVFERLARGVYDPENSYRTEPLYALVQEHLADLMTERALEAPEGDARPVLVEYTRFTGGTVQAPVGVGDRLMRNGIASGIWYTATVVSVETSGVTVLDDRYSRPRRWDRHDFHRWFFKLDRAPLPAAQAA
jgi:hypothetical protein